MTALLQLAFLATLLWPSVAAAQTEVRASELPGLEVQAPDGERFGAIVAVFIDSQPKGVHLVMLETPRGERFANPVSDLRRDKAGAVRLDVPPGQMEPHGERYERASALLGRETEDPLGNVVGALRDVAIDLDTGRTRYFLVEFAGSDNALLPLAPHLVRLHPGTNPVVTGRPHRRS